MVGHQESPQAEARRGGLGRVASHEDPRRSSWAYPSRVCVGPAGSWRVFRGSLGRPFGGRRRRELWDRRGRLCLERARQQLQCRECPGERPVQQLVFVHRQLGELWPAFVVVVDLGDRRAEASLARCAPRLRCFLFLTAAAAGCGRPLRSHPARLRCRGLPARSRARACRSADHAGRPRESRARVWRIPGAGSARSARSCAGSGGFGGAHPRPAAETVAKRRSTDPFPAGAGH